MCERICTLPIPQTSASDERGTAARPAPLSARSATPRRFLENTERALGDLLQRETALAREGALGDFNDVGEAEEAEASRLKWLCFRQKFLARAEYFYPLCFECSSNVLEFSTECIAPFSRHRFGREYLPR